MQPCEQGDTGVDIESNETAPARTSADAVRPGRLRGRCLAALVTFTALLTLPLQAEAQTTLVSNTGQTSDGTLGDSRDRAQAFTTGANSGGYTLSSVEIISADADGRRYRCLRVHGRRERLRDFNLHGAHSTFKLRGRNPRVHRQYDARG